MSIRPATAADIDAAAVTLREAFTDYPFSRHTVAADDHAARVERVQHLFLSRIGLPHGRVWVSDDVAAVAVWTTPTTTDLTEVFAELGPELAEAAGDRAEAAAAAEAALAPLRPTGPAWFLGVVGVRPDAQGRGLGRAIIEPGLRAAAEAGVEAYLETSLETNLAFYRKLGFEVTGELELPGGGPRTWAMRAAPPVK
ncbi:GNAT family N-acetyltransferase [Nocardia brasiliensis]|uniref:GNAT family N-acetyltransferase n=1 Tax=Nocardia brasiliensis TaxID=37326 RepID=A0A6G9XTJ4_NOCBR|nr:GNAT family N-acetyltransferase [Nocardia brasiliensis]QIS04170.1 GNAT family N-acetyltransferase [Nocardia brasiliensis]